MSARTQDMAIPALVNVASRRGVAAARRIADLAGIVIRATSSAAELEAAAGAAVGEGRERLLVVGGDGTLHHAIQVLAGSSCALGIVPTGTGNDLARALDLPNDPREAARRARDGAVRRIDLGRLGGRVFAGVAGMGIDSAVARAVNEHGGHRGPWIYPRATLRCLVGYRPLPVRVEAPGFVAEGASLLAAFANSPRFGAGMRIAPAARMDDGLLDLVFVARAPWPTVLTLLLRVYGGTHLAHRAVRHHAAASFSLACPRETTWVADGEVVLRAAPGTVRIECWPAALGVVA